MHAHDKVCVYPELSLQTRRLQRLEMTNFPGEFPFPAPLAFHIPHWHSKVGIHRGSVLFYPVVACCGWNKTRCFPSVRVSSPRYSGLGAHHTGLQWFFLRQHTAEGPPGLSLISSQTIIIKNQHNFIIYRGNLQTALHRLALPRWHSSKESACQCRRHKSLRFETLE